MASNNEWVVPASSDERRYFVLDVADERAQDHEYFQAILDEAKAGGHEDVQPGTCFFMHAIQLFLFRTRRGASRRAGGVRMSTGGTPKRSSTAVRNASE
jgi:hypothetical protein